jgi:MFS family permease
LDSETLPPHFRHNYRALMVGYISFGVAFTFINVNTVLPSLAGRLTDSTVLIGLIGTIFSGGWLLPQLFVARFVRDKPLMKPYILIGVAGRITLVVVAIALWGGLPQRPGLMLAVYYLCMAVFIGTDAFGSVPWFDFLARAIPLRRRGRLIGVSQTVSGIAGIGVGALIALILGNPRLPFARNYALLFALSAITLIPSNVALAKIRETPRNPAPADSPKAGTAQWLRPWVEDRTFRELIACRTFVALIDLATPFFVVHAADVLQLPQSVVGTFVVAQTAGSIAASAGLGVVCERFGPRNVIRIGSGALVLAPLLALGIHFGGGAWLGTVYPLVFVALGILNAVRMLGFTTYVLEIAPEAERPEYVGLANTLAGLLTIAPTLGGWLLQATSYPVLFALTAVFVSAGFVVSWRLRPAAARIPG